MKRITITIALVVALSGLDVAEADPGDTVVLYQPDAIVGHRLGGDAGRLASFILKAQDCWAQVITNAAARSKTALVVGFGRGRQSAGWIVGLATTNAVDAISLKLSKLQTPQLTDGFIAFAVLGKICEEELKKQKEFAPPVPDQWKQIAARQTGPMSTDDILNVLLPRQPEAKATAGMSQKPLVHNHITGKVSPLDEIIHKTFEARFTVVDVRDPKDYVRPKPIAGGMPPSFQTSSGEQLKGYVLLAYIVTTAGRAIEPVIIKSTDERLNPIALRAVEDWRFEPARLNGKAISTTAAQEFNFGDK